ncbi:MAG TPA: sulfatase-like hydrolase/transferase [Bacillota bacterium]|nr:sulfatase-like hydrolase/transferase [Bacillota bacterium]
MNPWIHRIKSTATWLYVLFLTPLILTIFVEFLSRGSLKDLWQWSIEHTPAFFANYLIVFSLMLLATSLLGVYSVAYWIPSILLVIPAIASGFKLQTEGSPLFPWDIVLGFRQLKLFNSTISSYFTWEMGIGLVLFLLFGVSFHYLLKRFKLHLNRVVRLATAIIACFIFAIPYADKIYPLKKNFQLSAIPYNQEQGYVKNGFLLSTLVNLNVLSVKEPPNYNKKKIQNILDQVKTSTTTDIHPNIIVVLSEAFWDPTLMEGIQFSEDPIPTFHQLEQQFSSGWMLSPQFGGGTANVEFEVLTGHSTRFLPDGSIPYVNYIHQEVDSLASILSRDGYQATAINPFYSWFFNSKNVYKDFGFSRFISSEFFPPHYEGLFLADREVANQIIKATDQTLGPDFIFANTMENHFPFMPGKFKENSIHVEGDLSDDSKGELETYAEGISAADRMLAQLVDYYSNKQEPTIVVFFGDHMPALSNTVYKEARYFQDNDPNQLEKKFREPVLIWNNYLPENKDSIYISPSFLGPYILHLVGQEGSQYSDYLYSLSQRVPVIPPDQSDYDKFHVHDSDLEDYKLLEYDSLFGNQYAYQLLQSPIVDPQYELGQGHMVIKESVEEETSDSEKLIVIGENFSPGSILYMNGTPTETNVESEEQLTASIPVEQVKENKLILQVKVKDSRNIVVATSNEIEVEGKKN